MPQPWIHALKRSLRQTLPLALVLPLLDLAAPLGAVREPVVRWAREALGLQGRGLRRWLRRAWWGKEAGLAVDDCLTGMRAPEVWRRLLPVDWTPIDRVSGDGRGLILAGAHLGPPGVAARLVGERLPETLFLVDRLWADAPERSLRTVEHAEPRAWSLAEAHLHLRRGGIVYLAADGCGGEQRVPRSFLGRSIRLGTGAAVLARMSGARSLPITALWEGTRIRIECGAPIAPSATDAVAWQGEWIDAFLAWLAGKFAGPAENLRLSGGLWIPNAEGGIL